ncbi:MAG: tRNA uridine(34) 5-carboxymethylaminomethyl modification radical SAM/GNAT enzyme Elp3, partial [Patescibacteria group bacterium]
ENLIKLLKELEFIDINNINDAKLAKLKKKFPKANGNLFKKSEIVMGYRKLAGRHGLKKLNSNLIKKITKRPVRTLSGVTPITVLTKPFPCPGKCIFCPSDVRMPKSYLADEPGAQRAERNWFDPYLQTYNRLLALHNMGHNVDKAELIVLGGTWSFYPEEYQIWFIKECFRALNDFGNKDIRYQILDNYKKVSSELKRMGKFSLTDKPDRNKKAVSNKQKIINKQDKNYNNIISKLYVAPEKQLGLDKLQTAGWDELFAQQKVNETTNIRCVGLALETRPDNISEAEIIRLRKLGCTKTQIGVQSLQDSVLKKNHRGHDVAATRKAFKLLRQAGFKIHAHWMANLYGSSVEQDKEDYLRLFEDPDFKPDELKVYPCSLIKSAELMSYFNAGKWQPYSYEELLEVVTFSLKNTPEYCRLTRVIRDISSDDIVAGNKKTNFRQIATQALEKVGEESVDIRAREIRNQEFDINNIKFEKVKYETSVSQEIFLQFISRIKSGMTPDDRLLAFLRLSLPKENSFIKELGSSAMIREIHVYGPAQNIGCNLTKASTYAKASADRSKDVAQHKGFGTQLIERAKELASMQGYKRLGVISAIGTKEYYRKKGFEDGELYQFVNT